MMERLCDKKAGEKVFIFLETPYEALGPLSFYKPRGGMIIEKVLNKKEVKNLSKRKKSFWRVTKDRALVFTSLDAICDVIKSQTPSVLETRFLLRGHYQKQANIHLDYQTTVI